MSGFVPVSQGGQTFIPVYTKEQAVEISKKFLNDSTLEEGVFTIRFVSDL